MRIGPELRAHRERRPVRPRTVAVVGLVAVLVAVVADLVQRDHGNGVLVVEVGWSEVVEQRIPDDPGEHLVSWVAVVENTEASVADYTAFDVEVLDGDGVVLDSRSAGVVHGLAPGSQAALAGTVGDYDDVPVDEVADIRLTVRSTDAPDHLSSEPVVAVGEITVDELAVVGYSPGNHPLVRLGATPERAVTSEGVAYVVVGRDRQGDIVAGWEASCGLDPDLRDDQGRYDLAAPFAIPGLAEVEIYVRFDSEC